jgi:alpha-N-arabinofuranosidase
MVSISAAKKADGSVFVSLANTSLDKAQEVVLNLNGAEAKTATGKILTSKKVDDYNDFDNPNKIKLADFKDAKVRKNKITVKLPAMSIVTINVK